MGGGASLMEGVEELVMTTMLIGRAISAMQFPGMFRIYDFHSKKAPKLKNYRPPSMMGSGGGNFMFFALGNGPDDEDEENHGFGSESGRMIGNRPLLEDGEPDPDTYSKFFKVTVNGDDIYLEDPISANESGWTPLHTCCLSLSTVAAGMALIEETLRLGGSLDTKTIHGPGTFNKGWTPLHMACAYGVDDLVGKLVEAGADVNATNCFGYTGLLEACHRGRAF
jgi:hypothetical protein